MKYLLLMRHAKSSWSNANLSDYDRPLNDRGRQAAPRMGQLLVEHDIKPNLIITSSAQRALQTAELVALACNYEHELIVTQSLYLAAPETYFQQMKEVPRNVERLLMVGHNPGIETLIEHLGRKPRTVTTANIGHFALQVEEWQECRSTMGARLLGFWQPKSVS